MRASAVRTRRAETPTRILPLASLISANRSDAFRRSQNRASRLPASTGPALAKASITSASPGGSDGASPAGQISATVSARSPT